MEFKTFEIKNKFKMEFKTFDKLAIKKNLKCFFLLLLLGKDNQIVEFSKKRSQLKAHCSGDRPGRLSHELHKYKKFFLSPPQY